MQQKNNAKGQGHHSTIYTIIQPVATCEGCTQAYPLQLAFHTSMSVVDNIMPWWIAAYGNGLCGGAWPRPTLGGSTQCDTTHESTILETVAVEEWRALEGSASNAKVYSHWGCWLGLLLNTLPGVGGFRHPNFAVVRVWSGGAESQMFTP